MLLASSRWENWSAIRLILVSQVIRTTIRVHLCTIPLFLFLIYYFLQGEWAVDGSIYLMSGSLNLDLWIWSWNLIHSIIWLISHKLWPFTSWCGGGINNFPRAVVLVLSKNLFWRKVTFFLGRPEESYGNLLPENLLRRCVVKNWKILLTFMFQGVDILIKVQRWAMRK